MNPKVNVLISAYNGQTYIREQIDSVLNQTYKNISVFVRDDGSTDKTIDVLKEYEKDVRVHVSLGVNKGYGPSFLELLKYAHEGEYWAYCDQDDVWFPEKIEKAVDWLEKQNPMTPSMYCCSYYNTDENLHIIDRIEPPEYAYTFVRSITECIHLGFCTVFNGKLRELILKGDPERLVTHDWWTELIAMKYGNVYYSDEPMAYHRRIQSSVSSNSLYTRWKWLVKAFHGNAEIKSCTSEFNRVFGDDMDDPEIYVNSWFCGEHYSIIKSLKKCFYPHRWRPSISSEIVVRMLMLFGKI